VLEKCTLTVVHYKRQQRLSYLKVLDTPDVDVRQSGRAQCQAQLQYLSADMSSATLPFESVDAKTACLQL
jgi:hypothetical protein